MALDFKRASPRATMEMLAVLEEQNGTEGDEESKAARYAGEVSTALGVGWDDMTDAQRKFVDAHRERSESGYSGKGYGFSIDPTGRKPNIL